jgi:seryl-tRNA synthetase
MARLSSMLNLEEIRRDPESLKARLRAKGVDSIVIDEIVTLDREHRRQQTEIQNLRSKHNAETGRFKAHPDSSADLAKLKEQRDQISQLESQARLTNAELRARLLAIPAPIDDALSSDSQEESSEATTQPEVMAAHGAYPRLREQGVLLYRSIVDHCVDTYVNRNFREAILPALLLQEILTGSGELPAMKDYWLKCEDDELFLAPSIESGLASLHHDEILAESQLPERWVSCGPTFNPQQANRPLHHYDRYLPYPYDQVAAFVYLKPEQRECIVSEVVGVLDILLQSLELPYRVVRIGAGRLGFAAESALWHEVWFPARSAYVPVGVTNSYGSYQARRTSTRFRDGGRRAEYTASVGQTVTMWLLLAAMLENHQQRDGSVALPIAIAERFGRPIIGSSGAGPQRTAAS